MGQEVGKVNTVNLHE